MQVANKLSINIFWVFLVFVFGIIFNQYFGNKGVFPIDSFLHFDTGYRVAHGEFPFKDYWNVSGPFIDLFQAIIFSIFGESWQSYILHGSIINGLFSALSFIIFFNFGLEKKFSFFYSICISILAYPVSATPFVDLHSTYLAIIGIYFVIFAIQFKKKIYWFFVPIWLFFAFFSKQVPAGYFFIFIIFGLIYFFTTKDIRINFEIFTILCTSTFFCILLLFIILDIKEIKFQNFLTQYLFYPSEIAQKRFSNFEYKFKNLFLDFKLIYLIFIAYLILSFYKLFSLNSFKKNNSIIIFFFVICIFISLIYHQIITKNQIFIFFLIPFYSALVHIEVNNSLKNNKNLILNLLIIFCLFATIKYHYRFNVERKFHELSGVDFINSVRGSLIDEKFRGLKWITPDKLNKTTVLQEIENINNIINILKKDDTIKMVITNYSFFSILLNNTQNGINRAYPGDYTAFPQKNSSYYFFYKNYFFKNLVNKKIENIYVLFDVSQENLTNYIDKNCLKLNESNQYYKKFNFNWKCDYKN